MGGRGAAVSPRSATVPSRPAPPPPAAPRAACCPAGPCRSFLWWNPQMLVDDIGDVTITNDGATILKQLEIEQPAAKILVELAELQEDLARELLRAGGDLVQEAAG